MSDEEPEAPDDGPEHSGTRRQRDVTVVTILREDLATTLRFVAWYLELEATRIALFFDDPEDPAIEVLAAEERVDCVRCTPEFWRDIGVEPDERFTLRQNAVLTHAYRNATTSWVLNVDSDELLWLDGRSLRRFAGRQGPEVRAVRVMPAEKVTVESDPDAAWFRMPMRRVHQRKVYGDDRPLFSARLGVVGHADGKSMIRTGLDIGRIRQHWAEAAEGGAITDKVVSKKQSAALLHFFDGGYERWRDKLAWRVGSSGLNGRLRELLRDFGDEAAEEESYRDLYRRLHALDAAQCEALAATGRYLRLEVDFDAPRHRLFGAIGDEPARSD